MAPFWISSHPTLITFATFARQARAIIIAEMQHITYRSRESGSSSSSSSSSIIIVIIVILNYYLLSAATFFMTFYCLWGVHFLTIILRKNAQWIPSAASRSKNLCWFVPVQQDQSNNDVSDDDDAEQKYRNAMINWKSYSVLCGDQARHIERVCCRCVQVPCLVLYELVASKYLPEITCDWDCSQVWTHNGAQRVNFLLCDLPKVEHHYQHHQHLLPSDKWFSYITF